MSVSHIGLRVRDLDTSKLFYEALGFTEVNRLTVPDKIAEGLLGLASPIGFEAIYLRKDAFVLQLLTFSGHPAPEEAERAWSTAASRTCRSRSTTSKRPRPRCGPRWHCDRRTSRRICLHGPRSRRTAHRVDPLQRATSSELIIRANRKRKDRHVKR